jgi:hypothetical protein
MPLDSTFLLLLALADRSSVDVGASCHRGLKAASPPSAVPELQLQVIADAQHDFFFEASELGVPGPDQPGPQRQLIEAETAVFIRHDVVGARADDPLSALPTVKLAADLDALRALEVLRTEDQASPEPGESGVDCDVAHRHAVEFVEHAVRVLDLDAAPDGDQEEVR